MTPSIIKYAINQVTGKSVFINNAENGLACNCKCEICGEKFEAIQGPINEWHYRHYKQTQCTSGQETAIHQYAKQIIVENFQMDIPKHGTIFYSNPVAEKQLISKRPDVTATLNGEKIFFEIAVKHFIEPSKRQFFKDGQYKSIEIDLSNVPYDITPDKLKDIVLLQINNKTIIFWEPQIIITTEIQIVRLAKQDSILTRIIRFCEKNPILAVIIAFFVVRFSLRILTLKRQR